MSTHPIGLALTCAADGTIETFLEAPVRRPDAADVGASLLDVVDAASREKAAAFLEQVACTGLVFDWALNLPFDRRPMLLYCSGFRIDGGTVVVAAPLRTEAAQLGLDVLSRMEGGDARLFQAMARDRVERFFPGLDPGSALYTEMSRLNNELAVVQRELVKKNYELERLNQQKNYFLGVAAHELRNPLCSIQFYSDYLKAHADRMPDDKRNRFLSVIGDSSGFMARLIEDLLSISQIEAGRLTLDREALDLVELAARNVEINRMVAESKEIDLRLDAAVDALVVSADAHKLDQVLNNLIVNALKFSEPGTDVVVQVERADAAARLCVRDEGPGIPEDELDDLFEPFRTTSVKATASERSTGLGLAISQRIVDGHGGRIVVESEVGVGSAFTVVLPLPEG